MKQISYLILISWLIVGASLLGGCHTPTETVTEYLDRYTVKVDTFTQRDSVYFRDSVQVTIKGDTVTRDRWHYAYKDRIVYKSTKDTVQVHDTTTVYIDRPTATTKADNVSWWKKIGDFFSYLAIALIIGFTITILIKWRLTK